MIKNIMEDQTFKKNLKNNNIALMLSHDPGHTIADYFFIRKRENIKAVYFEKKSKYSEVIVSKLKINEKLIFYGKEILSDLEHIEWIKTQNIDFVITVYWPWLLNKNYIKSVKNSVNFHPALLPINRGWYPHVHSIIDGSPAGVTLHKISEGADEGDIWAQKEISLYIYESAKDIYLKLQSEIINLFKDNWDRIKSGEIEPFPQNKSKATYHSKNEIDFLNEIDLDNISAKKFLNILRARTFGDKGFAYLKEDGKKYFLNLRINQNSNFN